ncbi:WD repeat and FYVE domain-containing protein 3 [Lingula anatina]|uniref:WD repeat and FYVE domain-containing protein 3 n=1 Tax=Lingula anatina TaxID=7574 RepID=A0A2R2MKD1_LINAN|nr:WD repeat and FYVE domain-containing protein 3 [Lingula anatina]|eukprot:XP_023930684.1 WD repeat and FYVE domain-containing protein 3 [Lingula anatina]
MNLMRKLVGQSARPGMEVSQSNSDNSLGLTHLRKLFAEFRHPSTSYTSKDQEEKLYNMLPLFCKVFGGSPSNDMTEKFGDILQFCSHVSKLMVTEIRRRASNQSTEAASCAIVKFLEIDTTEESSNGWMLLSTLNLLSTGAHSLIDCMTAASLPSTLVKCLYLFFDLPGAKIEDRSHSEFTSEERRILLQKVFVQVLVRLCSHTAPAEELARKDDLTLLFSAITSWCPAHNVPWRKSAAEVLMTLSRHGLTPNVVQYIHSKGCVALCIENMKRNQDLTPLEIVEMFVTVFCFLKDSSEVSQILLDDFRSCQGYIFLSDFLLRLEQDEDEETRQALRNLVLLMGSLTTCGYIELKPTQASTGSLYQMPGFTLPQPAGKGVSVRNIQAFQVLQSVFQRASSSHLCSIILDVISSIYHQDSANYFILEPQHTLSQFAEKVHLKPVDIQQKFFEIMEFICFNLNFVPCKELISISILLKTQNSIQCSVLCMKSLLKILRYHKVYKDVFREVGLLEVVVTCLHRYAALLKDSPDSTAKDKISDSQKELGFLSMEALSVLLSGNSNNAGVFRECGGARCAHNMVPYPECRQQALGIVQQLVLSSGGDDDMGTLLGLMHTAPVIALELKTHILKSLLSVLRESHRTRTVFRKVGGFVYVMSVLVSMEGCLAEPPKSPWETAERKDVLTLLKLVFSVLTVAMRYEPANAKFFATDVQYSSLTNAVRLLGCFSSQKFLEKPAANMTPSEVQPFEEFFNTLSEEKCPTIPRILQSACLMIRFMHDMVLDAFDRYRFDSSGGGVAGNESPKSVKKVPSLKESTAPPSQLSSSPKRASTGSVNVSLSLAEIKPDPVIVHSGAVISMLHLLPAVSFEDDAQLVLDLQVHVASVLKSLLRSERNQQVMCEADMPHELLSKCTVALEDESHPLHPPLQYMFERLAAQSLTPKDLRDFMRLGNPLSCAPIEEPDSKEDPDSPDHTEDSSSSSTAAIGVKRGKHEGKLVPLTRVKCLVSMTTPRDVRFHGSLVTPPFVQFDMNVEGFGCLYLPSIAPQGPPTPSVVGMGMGSTGDSAVLGGIGAGERVFPPQAGLTYSTWICVDKFSTNSSSEAHPVRLLTVVRNVQGREESSVCLSILLHPRDRALIVSTRETIMTASSEAELKAHSRKSGATFDRDPQLGDNTVRIWCPELTQEGQWHHLVLLFNKAGMLKNSNVSVFVDGEPVNTSKLHYISPNIGVGGTASPSAITSVFAYIGTPPVIRKQSRLVWRQGPCHLFEDVISQSAVQTIYQLGPNYVGCFQAPSFDDSEIGQPLVSEDRVIFGVYVQPVSNLTIAKIRKVYNKNDAKTIAKQLSMSAHDSVTPIRILHNAAGHLSGPARSFGAILMGYIGVRTFCPKPVAKTLENIGSVSLLMGLIAMADDVEGLYAAVKALVCVVKSNDSIMREMDRTRGYQTLAMLFKKKRHLLNSHILHLTFSLVGTVDSGRETTVIPNKTAFEDVLCDLQVWHEAPGDLQRSLYEHFYELLTESSEQKTNFKLMHEVGLVQKLLYILPDPNLSDATLQTIASVFTVLLRGAQESKALLKFGQFAVSTLPPVNTKEGDLSLEEKVGDEVLEGEAELHSVGSDLPDNSEKVLVYRIKLRNHLLQIILKLLYLPNPRMVNQQVSDEIQRVLGFDWLMLFLQGNLHPTTVVLAFKILVVMLGNATSLQRFREGLLAGGWLHDTEAVLENRLGVLLGFNVGSGKMKTEKREINTDVCHIHGFTLLQGLLPKHCYIPELYLMLMSLLLGQPVKELPLDIQFDIDSVWTYIFGVPASQPAASLKNHKTEFCPEAAFCILAMVRAIFNQSWQEADESSWERVYPVTLLQFLLFLYHNQPDFVPVCMSSEFLGALASTMFPIKSTSGSRSDVTTPTEEYKPLPGSEPMLVVNSPDNSPSSAHLCGHPAKKFVTDFMRQIVVDSLSHTNQGKSQPVIDLLLETAPEQSTRRQQKEFQTALLKSLMDHLLAADALMGEQAALPISSSGNYNNVANNVFYFASRVVDKLWQGMYVRDSKDVFEFVSKLIAQAKRRASGVSLDPIYKCLNRTILYHLSRPTYAVPAQMSVLDALHRLTSNRSLVFGPGNYDQEFIGCLCYCLLQLTDDSGIPTVNEETISQNTTWHVAPVHDSDDDLEKEDKKTKNEEGQILVAAAAKRVWEELYVCKKPAIEEVFKVSLNGGDVGGASRIHTPELSSVRLQIQEAASRVWHQFLENEKRTSLRDSEKLTMQLQSRIQRVGSGALRLVSRRSRKEIPVKAISLTKQESITWTMAHIAVVQDLVQLQRNQYMLAQQHMEKYLLDEWSQVESELMRERGVWGPPVGSSLDKWILDMTEGPCRMRKKMLKNDMFYIQYPYIKQDENKPVKYKTAVSRDSAKYYKRFRSHSLVGDENIPQLQADGSDTPTSVDMETIEENREGLFNPPSLLRRANSNKSMNSVSSSSVGGASSAGGGSVDNMMEEDQDTDLLSAEPGAEGNKPDNETLLRLLDEGEKITHMFRCARIQGLDTCEGLLLFGKEHFYVVDGFTLLSTREIADIDSVPPEYHDPIIPTKGTGGTTQKRLCSKFNYEDIKEVLKRRYLLQPIAIEVFSADGRNFLLSFPKKIRNKVYARFMAVASSLTDNAQQSVAGQKQNAKIEPGTGIISSLIGEKSVTQRWERGEITNFQYLMYLNTLAGRSYNDLMQYPVFPWIVADYDSEELDLTQPETFRDLSKPMGVQTPNRLKQFIKRYKDWDDPTGETPPYHYGTHYSSAMIVASYLVRMEPFTQHFLRLQGGHFDLADRMFHSVKEMWLSASQNNMADVKELIPELFYLPDFLLNSNNFDLGLKQSGVPLGDVILPPWAKGDPREFIRAHREALECDYVSAHLHEWIDLIFGYKQQGPAAVEAVNVFHHLFYEGNVDIYTIDDPLKKNATIGFINNFGQIPKQLFKKPHPSKKLNIKQLEPVPVNSPPNSMADKLFFHNVDNLRPSMQPIKELKNPVGQILHTEKAVLAVEQNKVLIPTIFNRYLAWGFADLSLRIGAYDSDKAISVFENLDSNEILCASCPSARVLVTGGTSTVVNVWKLGDGKDKRQLSLRRPLYGHTEPVTCIAASAAYNLIVSGSRDRTCILWDLSRLNFVRQLRGHVAPVAAVAINELTGDIATCAGTYLYVWNINGEEIAHVNTATSRNQQILCVEFSQMMEWDSRNVILTGSSDGVVRMYSVEYVQVPTEEYYRKQEQAKLRLQVEKDEEEESKNLSVPKSIPDDNLSACSSTEKLDMQDGDQDSIDYSSSVDEGSNLERYYSREFSTASTATTDGEDGLTRDGSGRGLSDEGGADTLTRNDSGRNLSDEGGDDTLKRNSGAHIISDDSGDGTLKRNSGLHLISDEALSEASVPSDQAENNSEDVMDGNILTRHNGIEAPKISEPGVNPSPSISDYVIIDDQDVKSAPPSPAHSLLKYSTKGTVKLRDGFKWQRQLVFRSKLTMHTAYERKDNRDPAAVTALAVSKCHKTVFVGDAKGRVFSWSVTDQPGRVIADHWVRDETSDVCVACGVKFSFSERRHHCRNCGQLFCSKCSKFEIEIPRLRIHKPVRVCLACHNILRAQEASDALTSKA